jgi:hypothetical protein
MMPSKKLCMPSFEKVGTLYGENGDTPLISKISLQISLHESQGPSFFGQFDDY